MGLSGIGIASSCHFSSSFFIVHLSFIHDCTVTSRDQLSGPHPTTRTVGTQAHVDKVVEVHSVPKGKTPLPTSKEAPKANSGQDELIVKKELVIAKMKRAIDKMEHCCGTKPTGEIVAALPCWTSTTTYIVYPGNKPNSTTAAVFSWDDAHVVVAGSGIINTSAPYRVFDLGRRCVHDCSQC